jgi:tetratricopeptide (TPR) repeat protein
MAEQSGFNPKNIELQTLGPALGLLEQFNLPPGAIKFIRRNQRTLWIVVVGCVTLAVAFAAYASYRQHRIVKAASALDAALVVRQDSRALLEKVVQEYAATPSGWWAGVELGLLDAREGQTGGAITRFEAINATLAPQDLRKPLVLGKLGGLYEIEKQWDKALLVYGDLAVVEGFAADAYRALGRVNEQLGKNAEAATMYQKYLEMTKPQGEQGKSDPVREMVQTRLNLLKK